MGLPLKVGTVFTYHGTTYKITEINQGANMVMTVEVGGRGKGHYTYWPIPQVMIILSMGGSDPRLKDITY
jgi:hypothetical protein